MKKKAITGLFRDSPDPEQLREALAVWQRPDQPSGLKGREKDEKTLIKWLYDLVRLNVKRGRVFNLSQVLQTGEADCLGYAKLFSVLARQCGLDSGVVEIITDNRGRNVPHTCALVRLADGPGQFVDFWYGSPDIRHKRLGLQVKRADTWNIEDIDFPAIRKAEDISYLPDDRVDAITLYIEGNRALKEGRYAQAVEQFSDAIKLYPQNARFYYNRAVAYEKLGQPARAEADYAEAMRDETALKRTLATQPQDTVDLIALDEAFIPDIDQEIYLLRQGFITGRPVSSAQIALQLAMPREDVTAILKFIRRLLKPGPRL